MVCKYGRCVWYLNLLCTHPLIHTYPPHTIYTSPTYYTLLFTHAHQLPVFILQVYIVWQGFTSYPPKPTPPPYHSPLSLLKGDSSIGSGCSSAITAEYYPVSGGIPYYLPTTYYSLRTGLDRSCVVVCM